MCIIRNTEEITVTAEPNEEDLRSKYVRIHDHLIYSGELSVKKLHTILFRRVVEALKNRRILRRYFSRSTDL